MLRNTRTFLQNENVSAKTSFNPHTIGTILTCLNMEKIIYVIAKYFIIKPSPGKMTAGIFEKNGPFSEVIPAFRFCVWVQHSYCWRDRVIVKEIEGISRELGGRWT